MYLHHQDRAYTAEELFEFVEDKGGMHIVDYSEPYLRYFMREYKIQDEKLKDVISKKSRRKRWAIAELIWGNVITHPIYISKVKDSKCDMDDVENTSPFFMNMSPKHVNKIYEALYKGIAETRPYYFYHLFGQLAIIYYNTLVSKVALKMISNGIGNDL